MIARSLVALGALALVAGCKAQEQTNASAGSDNLVQSAETRTAAAAPLSKEQALALMKERHDHMESLGDETKKISNQLKASSPDLAAIKQSAAKIAELAPKVQSWFPEGTGPEAGKTRAKPEIWRKPEDFTVKAHDLEQAAHELDAAAGSGDLGQVKATFAAMGKACKACHDSYRAPKKD